MKRRHAREEAAGSVVFTTHGLRRWPRTALVVVVVCVSLGVRAATFPQKEAPMTDRAVGTFDVTLKALATEVKSDAGMFGRMSVDKLYHGDLEGAGTGEMLTAGTAVKDSAAYVAIERFTGTLKGRSGTFALQHVGTMARGAQQLSITVVPDSGTGQLAGLSGRLDVVVADGKHSYIFDYTIAATP